jgi:hypothetical protein
MPVFQRATMPENFYDITSNKLLAQPEPQFLYAVLMLAALGASLQVPGELGLPGRGISGNGADYTPAEKDRLMLASPLSTDLFAATVDFNGLPGTTVRFNRPAYTNSTYTQASRLIASGTSISTTPITGASQQNSLTLQRFGGPYGSAVQPYGADRFDTKQGVHKAASIFGTWLARDFHKTLDSFWVTLFDLAATAVYPEGMSAVNDATAAGQYPLTLEQVFRTEAAMDTANLPTFSDGFRILVLTPTQVNQLRNNQQFQKLATFFPQFNALFPQYVGSIGKFHIFKSTTLSTTANSSSVAIHYGHALAPGVGMVGMGEQPRVASSTNDNYGEMPLFIWLAYLALGLANNSFVYSVRSSA